MTRKKKNKYNRFSEDFRREAVRRSEDPNTSAVEVAKELGISPGQIYNWRMQFKKLTDKQFNSLNGVDYSCLLYTSPFWILIDALLLDGSLPKNGCTCFSSF